MSESSTGTDGNRRRQTIVAVGLVFLVALGLRMGHLAALDQSFSDSSLFTTPVVDAAHHWEEAQRILDGSSDPRDRVPWKGPGYSWFLAGLAAIFGRSLGNVRWALALLGALNCALLVLLARRLLSLGWSVAAGLLAAINGILIVYDGEPYFPTLLIVLNLGVFFLLSGAHRGVLVHTAAGIMLGLACLVHPAYLLPAVLLLPWILRRGPLPALAWCLAIAAVIAPVTLTNLLLRDQPVLISWNGGANLYAANHPTYDQRAGNASFAWGRILNTTVDAGIEGEAERDRAYYRLARRQAARYPVESVATLAKKALIFFSPPEIASNFRIYQLREHSPVAAATLGRWGPLWVPFGLWGPAAILGLALLLRRPAPLTTALILWSLGVLFSCLLFFNTARYRAPVVFFGCIWVAAALRWVVRRWREGDRRRSFGAVAIWVVLVVILASVAVPQTDFPPPLEFYEAQARLEAGSTRQMEEWAGRAVKQDPGSPALGLFVAELFSRAGRTEQERDQLNRVLALPDLEPDAEDSAHEALARSFMTENDLDGARREFRAALEINADAAEWRGYPYYRMEMGPVRACWLRLYLAEVEILDDRTDVARELIDRVQTDCPHGSRYPAAIGRLERMIVDRHGIGAL